MLSPIAIQAPSDLAGRGGDLLAQKSYAKTECGSVEIGMQTHSNCMKNKIKTFTILTSNETAITQKIVIWKACVLKDFCQQLQSSKSKTC